MLPRLLLVLMLVLVCVRPVSAQITYTGTAYIDDPIIGAQYFTAGTSANVYFSGHDLNLYVNGANANQQLPLDYWQIIFYDDWSFQDTSTVVTGWIRVGFDITCDANGHWEDLRASASATVSVDLGQHNAYAEAGIYNRANDQIGGGMSYAHFFSVLEQ
jgi:hypothetical protein